MLTRANPLGWAPFEELLASQINAIDSQLPRAIDGGFGGSYGPDDPIELADTNTPTPLKLTGTANWLAMTAREVTLQQGLIPVWISNHSGGGADSIYDPGAAGDWAASSDAAGFMQRYVDTSGPGTQIPSMFFELKRYPSAATITKVGVKIYKSGSTDPAVMPKAKLWVVADAVGAAPSVQAGDTVNVAASYRGQTRLIEIPLSLPVVVPADYGALRFLIQVFGEGGSGAAIGMTILNTFLSCSIDKARP